ncbi:MAG TPA: hypothetical protein VJM50_13480 [Pyrinomonadaceae bacterium]|nr:hypothetical protein [Pyrinomonadaceae bacterium]
MKDETITDAVLREFLLGKTADEELERIENLFLTDSQARERVLALEQELVEDYLENNLTQEDKARFLLRYAQTDEQRRQIRITRTIKDWALREAMSPQPAPTASSVWSRFWSRLRAKPLIVVPIAVMIVIATVLAVVWINSQRKQRKHRAIQQELTQLNSPTNLREVPPQMTSLDLRPVTLRSDAPQTELKTRANIHIVELRLPWIKPERYRIYQAELRAVGGDDSYTIPGIQAENDGTFIRIRVPARILNRGHYRIILRGISSDGSPGLAEEYSFAVSG